MSRLLTTALLVLPLTASAFEYRVGVGKDETTGKLGIGFDPSSIRPAAGDTLVFEYRAGVHSAVQTTFENPCTPMPGGYDSGIITVPEGTLVDAPGLPTTTFQIQSTDPLWFYDGASGECHLGAVFSVNPPLSGDQTAGAFLEKAKATAPQAASSPAVSTTAAAATSSPAAAGTSAAAASTTSAAAANSASNLAMGSKAFTAVSALAVVGFGAFALL
ncbi:hypothetical protein FRC03_003751 [Tulasnella sp. 419]|nr:hypothetical protein FRC03_003751 [Tulasnella sp. 419]